MENKLREIREAKKMSQEEVANALHVSRQSISKWENGRSNPDLDNMVALSMIYGVSLDELVHGVSVHQDPGQSKKDKDRYDVMKILFYLTVLLASTFISFIGIGVSLTLLIRMRKKGYPMIFYGCCILCLLISIFNLFVVLNGYFFNFGTVTIR